MVVSESELCGRFPEYIAMPELEYEDIVGNRVWKLQSDDLATRSYRPPVRLNNQFMT